MLEWFLKKCRDDSSSPTESIIEAIDYQPCIEAELDLNDIAGDQELN